MVRDIIKEHSPNINFPNEFRILKDPHGLQDLYRAITEIKSPEYVDFAIHKYLWLCKNLARPNHRLYKVGFGYQQAFKQKFISETVKLIGELTDYRYPLDWHLLQFERGLIMQLPGRMLRLLPRKLRKAHRPRRLGRMVLKTDAEVIELMRGYLNELFQIYDSHGLEMIGLHNGTSAQSFKAWRFAKLLCPDAKLVIVDRDPRDVYVNFRLDSYSRYLPATGFEEEKLEFFARFYESVRADSRQYAEDASVKIMQFEQFCLDYDAALRTLKDFLQLDSLEHTRRQAIFDPARSRENVKLWCKPGVASRKPIEFLESRLSRYLWTANSGVKCD